MDSAKVIAMASIGLLGAMSPGPDVAIVTRNCIGGTFRSGCLTALGIVSALSIHITYCLLGIAIVIQESPLLFNLITYLGATYLFYLGIMLLKEEISPEGASNAANAKIRKKRTPFISGFLCNLLNPKATLFVLSLFSQLIDPGMPFLEKVLLGGVFAMVGFLWFVLLSYLLTHRLIQKHFIRFQHFITRTMGIALCLLAVYVAFLRKYLYIHFPL
jgi:RhtB (resistance to homoserine/threonine) family protein